MNVPPQFAPLAPVLVPVLLVGGVVYAFALRNRNDPRLFTYGQRTFIGNAFGANCVWRPVHWLPAALAYVCLNTADGGMRLAVGELVVTPLYWRNTGQALLIVAGIGLPITRTSGRCGGTVQGGHQQSHHEGGTASIWNCSPECATHNLDKLTTGSWRWAFSQWPWTVVAYAPRHVYGTVRAGFMLLTDDRARRQARKGTR